jgi:hypothetical protein
MKADEFEISRKNIQAAINLRAAMNEIQKLAGQPLNGNQAVKRAEDLLGAIAPLAPLAPQPFLLSTSKADPKAAPEILDALAIVLGRQTLDIGQIAAALQERGWLPSTPRSIRYVSDLLSRNSEGHGINRFTRVRRGAYKVTRKRKLVFRKSA